MLARKLLSVFGGLGGLGVTAFGAPASVATFEVWQAGKKIGSASYRAQVSATGKETSLIVTLKTGDTEITYSTLERLDRQGSQVGIEVNQRVKRGDSVGNQAQTISFAPNGNAVVKRASGSQVYPFKRTGRRGDISEFWFLQSKPSPSTWVNFRRFNPERMEWETCRTTYVGIRPITVNGRTVSAHLVTQQAKGRDVREQAAWLDVNGVPVRISSGNVRFDRQW